jgi:CRISPR-associated protein Cas5t
MQSPTEVLKIVVEGTVTSFRYPYFVQGIHPTFKMPPPATIYGHVCSAVGEYISPARTRFAYHFTYESSFQDYEHLLFFPTDGDKPPLKPAVRELLFRPRLTLYLTDTSLEPYFRHPEYAVSLGRSQDLMTYTEVRRMVVEPADAMFFEHTLLPLEQAPRIGQYAYTVTMPRYIDPRRRATNAQYAVITTPVTFREGEAFSFEGQSAELFVADPEVVRGDSGLPRGIIWHDWQ